MVAIFVVLTFAACILVDSIVQRVRAKKKVASVTWEGRPETAGAPLKETWIGLENYRFQIPKGLFFHPGHTWLTLHRSGLVRVGIDDFTQRILGAFDALKTPSVGEEVKQGEPFFAVKQGDRLAKFVSPVDGTIVAINEKVLDNPDVIKQQPYTDGWLFTIDPSNFANDMQGLNTAERALAWLQREVERFQSFVRQQLPQDALVGQTLQDGGPVIDGLLAEMDDESWYHFESQFLQPAKASGAE